MRRVILAFTLFFSLGIVSAQPPKGKAKVGECYGDNVHTAGWISLQSLAATLKAGEPVSTKVKARVVDVCPKKGCWLKLEVNDSTTAFVKMKDYSFFLPTAIKGKDIVLEGLAERKITSVKELQHYAEDAKKTKAEIEAITAPQEEIRLTASGIIVVK